MKDSKSDKYFADLKQHSVVELDSLEAVSESIGRTSVHRSLHEVLDHREEETDQSFSVWYRVQMSRVSFLLPQEESCHGTWYRGVWKISKHDKRNSTCFTWFRFPEKNQRAPLSQDLSAVQEEEEEGVLRIRLSNELTSRPHVTGSDDFLLTTVHLSHR